MFPAIPKVNPKHWKLQEAERKVRWWMSSKTYANRSSGLRHVYAKTTEDPSPRTIATRCSHTCQNERRLQTAAGCNSFTCACGSHAQQTMSWGLYADDMDVVHRLIGSSTAAVTPQYRWHKFDLRRWCGIPFARTTEYEFTRNSQTKWTAWSTSCEFERVLVGAMFTCIPTLCKGKKVQETFLTYQNREEGYDLMNDAKRKVVAAYNERLSLFFLFRPLYFFTLLSPTGTLAIEWYKRSALSFTKNAVGCQELRMLVLTVVPRFRSPATSCPFAGLCPVFSFTCLTHRWIAVLPTRSIRDWERAAMRKAYRLPSSTATSAEVCKRGSLTSNP